ncbi:nuclease [Sporosarcina luteola]|uniref:Nuclease n=1 Tax=Sporosarcina luteola TaxID=582850 RepID=A0A511Z7E2_9BACL|nr:nuclease-related domain-containing protein [Sporosarcina luteola]GEN83361.1 nuclease [Sporosarcina luteola]
MLYKKRNEPLSLLGLQSLINRLSTNHKHYARIEEDLRKRKAGFSGETNFDRHILEFRPTYPIGLLHDLCLIYKGIYFQMDSLLIKPDGIIIFEVKNLAGKITVKAKPTQFIQENKEGRRIIQSPITELERKKILLDGWLNERGMTLPIKGIIGLAYTNELYIEDESSTEISFNQEIPIRLYNIPVEQELLSHSQIREIAHDMANSHQEYNPFPLTKTMGIAPEDIMPGVICPNCQYRGMKWHLKKWNCLECTHFSSDSHHDLLTDWFYLMDNKITNRQFRSFSKIGDRSVAKRLLIKSGLNMKGKRSTSFYTR